MSHRRQARTYLAATLAVVAGSALAACGNGSSDAKLLSQSSASELRSTLAEVEGRVENGDCEGAQEFISLFDQQIDSLNDIDADLRDALASGASRLEQLVAEKCQAPVTETGTTGATGPVGTTDTGGTTAPEEEQTEEGNGQGKEKNKEKNKNKDQSDEQGGDDGGGGSGGSGTTGSGGFAP